MASQVNSTGGERAYLGHALVPKPLRPTTLTDPTDAPPLTDAPLYRFFDFAHLQVADLKAKTVAIVGDGFRGAPRGMGFPIYVAA